MTTHRRIRQNPLAEEKKLRDDLEEQPISFDLAYALRDFIESGRQDACGQTGDGTGCLDERIKNAQSHAAAVDVLRAALTKLTTPIADE